MAAQPSSESALLPDAATADRRMQSAPPAAERNENPQDESLRRMRIDMNEIFGFKRG